MVSMLPMTHNDDNKRAPSSSRGGSDKSSSDLTSSTNLWKSRGVAVRNFLFVFGTVFISQICILKTLAPTEQSSGQFLGQSSLSLSVEAEKQENNPVRRLADDVAQALNYPVTELTFAKPAWLDEWTKETFSRPAWFEEWTKEVFMPLTQKLETTITTATATPVEKIVENIATTPASIPNGALVRHLPPLKPGDVTAFTNYPQCRNGTTRVEDIILPENEGQQHKIPKYVHQTSKSRCLAEVFVKTSNSWRLPGWSYFFWDDDAIMRLFRMHYDEFPNLQAIAEDCLPTGTLRGDLWRYLVLYTYGGVYADVDSMSGDFDGSQILPDTDAFFIRDSYGLLSQFFNGVSPGHPLLYYTIQDILHKVYTEKDTKKVSAPGVTGPHALARGFQQFLLAANFTGHEAKANSKTSVWHTPFVTRNSTGEVPSYVGADNRTITVVGDPKNMALIKEFTVPRKLKYEGYALMGMSHFSKLL